MRDADGDDAATAFWTGASRSFLAAQEGVLHAVREGAAALAGQASPAPPDAPPRAPGAVPDADAATALRAMTELWSAALSMSATLAGGLPSDAGEAEGTAARTLRRMMDPAAWLSAGVGVDEALYRMGDAGEMERRLAEVSRAWLALRQRGAEHQAVMLEGWTRAGRDFAARVAGLGADDEARASPRRMLDLWVEAANRALLETQRSEPFLRGQAAMLRASTDLRLAQRALAEHCGEGFGLPTRRELDDVHRSVTEIRRELRALRRQAATAPCPAAPEPPAAPPPPPEDRPAPRASGARRAAPRRRAKGG